jgi:hypothetical protein
MPIDSNRDRAWYESKLFTKSIIYGFSLLVLVKFSHSVFFKQNDFDWHLGYGYLVLKATHFSDSEAFRSLIFYYPPGRMLIDEALVLLPRLVARAIFFCAAIGALLITQKIWRELAQKVKPASHEIDFAAAALAFLLFAPWVVRDFDECGLQILLLFFYPWPRGRFFEGRKLKPEPGLDWQQHSN